MKKYMAILIAILMTLTFALAEGDTGVNDVMISLDANATTGYAWTGFVLGGDSVLLVNPDGAYVPDETDPDAEPIDGAGGQTWFKLTPVQPGSSIVVFTYARPWEPETAEQTVMLADVDENLYMNLTDITESGVIEGTVLSVDEAEHSVQLDTEAQGEVTARFDADMQLPAAEERITIYTNGTMTMSLPAIMNVIAWSPILDDFARTDA